MLDDIARLRKLIQAIPFEPFFEPKWLVELGGPKPVFLDVELGDINAWRRHVSDGCMARLASLEDALFNELENDRLTATMVLTRAHMEVAGLAAYSSNALFSTARSGEWDKLTKLVQQTYFGSSMRIQAKGTPSLNEILLEESYPIKPSDLIKAMDKFDRPDDPKYTHYQVKYGLLSEFTHPAMRATRHFASVKNSNSDGWLIQYHDQESFDEDSIEMACDILLNNMRIGYACCNLLRLARIESTQDGEYVFYGPSEIQLKEIWKDILQRS
jgi:hypothetical protein